MTTASLKRLYAHQKSKGDREKKFLVLARLSKYVPANHSEEMKCVKGKSQRHTFQSLTIRGKGTGRDEGRENSL